MRGPATAEQRAPGPQRPSPQPVGAARRWLDRRPALVTAAGLTALFVLVSIVMAFPSVAVWRTATPGDFGDSFLIQYLLRWDVHALLDRSADVLDPNIYWPTPDTLLYSDTQLAVAPFGGLLSLVTGWTVAYNLLYLSGWVISLASTYALARWLRASRPAAVLAGLVFTFAAVRLGHFGHFQLQFAYFVPLTAWLLLRFFEERRWWQAAAVGLCGAATFLNAAYIAVALVPTLAVVVLGWLVASRFRPGPRFLPGLALAGVVALAPTAPILSAYGEVGDYLRRPYIPAAAVTPKNFLAPAPGSPLYGWLEDLTDSPFENRLFPGFLAIGLGGVGAVTLWRTRRGSGSRSRRPPVARPDLRRRGLLLLLLASTVPLLLAFGKSQRIAGADVTLPYAWVADLPGFQSIRGFGRFTVVPLLALALLAATGFDRLLRGRGRRATLVAAAVLGTMMLAEYKAKIVMAPRAEIAAFTTVNHTLARLPDGPVLELPVGDPRDPSWAFTEAPRMLLSTIDWKPRVNGYSGYWPPGYLETVATLNSLDDGVPASDEVLGLLDRLAVRYIVIRVEPLDRSLDGIGLSYLDDAGARRVVDALPAERVEGVTWEWGAVLVRLTPPTPSTP